MKTKSSTLVYLICMLSILVLMKGCATVQPSSMDGSQASDARYIERALDDRMLVMDIHSLFKKLALIKDLVSAEIAPDRLQKKTRGLTKQLNLKRKGLLKCSTLHQDKKINLALDCAYLAHKVVESDESSENLNQIKKLITERARTNLAGGKSGLRASSGKKQKKVASSEADQKESIDALNHLLVIAPKDKEAVGLLKKLRSSEEKLIARLMAKGDKLYREQKVEKALAVWREAAALDANNKSVASRISRARKVLGGVNKIKKLPKQ